MKLYFVMFIILNNFICTPIMATNALNDLHQRLKKVNSFYAHFYQKVTDINGMNVQDGKGELWVKRPNKFNYHMFLPDEIFIISDGKNLWFYNPFIEQVSISFLEKTINDTPLILIARNHINELKRYNIKQDGDNFELTLKDGKNNVKFKITVETSGTINQFSAIEQDGQSSQYQLINQINKPVSLDKFVFIPPKGVTIDDQRE